MREDLLDVITKIKPRGTLIVVLLLMKQGMSKEDAWKKYKEMDTNDPEFDY